MIDSKEQSKLLETLKKAKNRLKKFHGIRDIALGFKYKNGVMTNEIAIIVYVYNKFRKDELEEKQILPASIEGIPIDIIESNPIEHPLENPYGLQNPLFGGLCISNTKLNSAGTLGAIVYDRDTNMPLGLTNHHVLIGNGNVFRRGGRKGDRINQPAFKPDSPKYNIGRLLKGNKHFDCSVFEVSGREIETVNELNGISGPIKGTKQPLLGMPIKKTGARTGVTYGIISAVTSELERFTISPNPQKPAFNGEISSAGDSGSVWVTDTDDNFAIGLHWGGDPKDTPDSEAAYAINIHYIMYQMNIKF
jgi:endonuclease G